MKFNVLTKHDGTSTVWYEAKNGEKIPSKNWDELIEIMTTFILAEYGASPTDIYGIDFERKDQFITIRLESTVCKIILPDYEIDELNEWGEERSINVFIKKLKEVKENLENFSFRAIGNFSKIEI